MAFKLQLAELFRKTSAINICRNKLMHSQFYSRKKFKDIQWQWLQNLFTLCLPYCSILPQSFNENGIKPQDIQSTKDLHRLPVLTKKEIRKYYNELLAENRDQYKPRLLTSEGSTGEPIRFFIDQWTNGYQCADAYRCQVIGGWNFGDKMVKIWGSSVLSLSRLMEGFRQRNATSTKDCTLRKSTAW